MHNVIETTRRLRELGELGVSIAIDDFGTGYSSLAYLQQFPVDCLKIDQTFIDALSRSPESDALIHTLVRLGRTSGCARSPRASRRRPRWPACARRTSTPSRASCSRVR